MRSGHEIGALRSGTSREITELGPSNRGYQNGAIKTESLNWGHQIGTIKTESLNWGHQIGNQQNRATKTESLKRPIKTAHAETTPPFLQAPFYRFLSQVPFAGSVLVTPFWYGSVLVWLRFGLTRFRSYSVLMVPFWSGLAFRFGDSILRAPFCCGCVLRRRESE